MSILHAVTRTPSSSRSKELRFEFGKNWAHFLQGLSESRIVEAELSLKKVLRVSELVGKSFLDIGCGSGLLSLAARRLGARVHSFDYDDTSVACARMLRERFYSKDLEWTIDRGSALDEMYIRSLGEFDIVYSWGVLHHTGDLYRALDLVHLAVAPTGRLLLSIYNDQGAASQRWKHLKRMYVSSPRPAKFALEFLTFAITWGRRIPLDMIRLDPLRTFNTWKSYAKNRGMKPWHDIVDWAGGFPFEVAKPETIFGFYRERGFHLEELKTCGGELGCNEFLFVREQ